MRKPLECLETLWNLKVSFGWTPSDCLLFIAHLILLIFEYFPTLPPIHLNYSNNYSSIISRLSLQELGISQFLSHWIGIAGSVKLRNLPIFRINERCSSGSCEARTTEAHTSKSGKKSKGLKWFEFINLKHYSICSEFIFNFPPYRTASPEAWIPKLWFGSFDSKVLIQEFNSKVLIPSHSRAASRTDCSQKILARCPCIWTFLDLDACWDFTISERNETFQKLNRRFSNDVWQTFYLEDS